MSAPLSTPDVSTAIAQHLPYLRRYARALTGSQGSGDAYALATLEAILEDRSALGAALPPKCALFRAFHLIWTSSGAPVGVPAPGLEGAAQHHMRALTPDSREALLLSTIEEFSTEDISQIIDVPPASVERLLDLARKEMERSISGKVLVIEDEAIIAMDLHAIITDMGHAVTGIGRTRDGAVDLGRKETPDLILADIQLADNSSGIDAVNDILGDIPAVPVIFVTAFPERLLTGERPEPAFVIAKPFSEDQIRSAVSQAMFFASTATLKA
jgi:DNA-directed RNA polymerase specialized sigma24 family protein/CheY-like chemotaxis protein